ncbi:MFS transporter [Paenibacillus thalictri]|uniref:MFS transporter n=1 Tax=Paenibacillus thalictri TaxID=2527873 RepID=A0A4Q9DGJ2_9BACL|nr:MFS transporter [Paenibacillus thalictri]TBL69406.1 MFS transporter [Paenibacillus thalictri]
MEQAHNRWDSAYEWKVVLLLALGFGLVGLDRWIITPLFPVMMKDLNLNYQHLGNIIAILGLAWGVFSIIIGGLSDKIGRRKVLIPSIILFSLLSGLTGMAGGLTSLLLIRCIMGITEGSFCPTSVAATSEASLPKRRGFNMGLQQSTFALFGLGFGPIIATQLLGVLPSWHWVFVVVAIPGFILAYFMHRIIKEPKHIQERQETRRQPEIQANKEKHRWVEIFRYRNIILCLFGLCGIMTCIFVLSAMVPNYLTDYMKLSIPQMGFVTSAIGFGAFLGQLVIPGLSDRFGRKIVTVVALIIGIFFMLLFINTGANPFSLFSLLFAVAFFCNGCLCMLAGTITIESVPAALISTAAGTIIGVGEIFGGGIAPSLAGLIALNYGIQNTLYLALTGLVLCSLLCLFLKETAPIRTVSRDAGLHMP